MNYLIIKEIKQMLTDRIALFTILLTPLLLILILGFSLAGWFGSNTSTEGISIGIIQEVDLADEASEVADTLQIPQEQLIEMAIPDSLFAYVENEMTIDYVNDVDQALQDGYDVVVDIPAGYRTKMWEQQIVGESSLTEEFTMYHEGSMEALMVDTMISQFMERLYVNSTLIQAGEESIPELGQIQLQGEEPLSSFEYYTYGMSVMYVFFSAGYMASLAYSEKKARVYARLVLANIKPLQYLAVKTVATMGIVIVQLVLLFSICLTLFQVSVANWFGFIAIALSLSLAVAGVTALLIAIQFRFETEKLANVFMMFVVSIFAFIGGSFFRVSDMAPILAEIGRYTPNGRALQAFIQASQGETLSTLSSSILLLSGMALVFFLLAWTIFISKGGAVK
ncbi:hypothetical protein JCM19046_1826 [Bacillus sp. JCM 19046]|nr:hypothetical protein JCM19046_1826 [Bacillus sp. JCM 19046]